MKKAQQITQNSANELNQMHTSAAVESQRFEKNSVIHYIDQYTEKLSNECNVNDFGASLRGISDKTELDKSIADFIKRRAQYNKTLIMKNKLVGINKLPAN